jgi:hypothetical protein
MSTIPRIILNALLFHSFASAQTCAVQGYFSDQNLAIADISGSTPTHYPDTARKPQPSTAIAWACIRLPQHRALQAGTYPNNTNPQVEDPPVSIKEKKSQRIDVSPSQNSLGPTRILHRQTDPPPCKPNALLFARGTIPDWGTMGTVGDALSRALTAQQGQADDWYLEDVKYWNDGIGFSCYGLPGGRIALDQLTALGNRCNDTKIVVGGFSQGTHSHATPTCCHYVQPEYSLIFPVGAMVARIAVANAAPSIKERVAAVVTFGDPVSSIYMNWKHDGA